MGCSKCPGSSRKPTWLKATCSALSRMPCPIWKVGRPDARRPDHPLFAGRPGTIGNRAGNFCLQAADFLLVIGSRLNLRQISYNWAHWCRALPSRYPVLQPHHTLTPRLNPYAVVDYVFARLPEDDIIVCGNASACILPFQVRHLRAGQRLFSISGSASMGYDLPTAIGAAMVAGGAGSSVSLAMAVCK